MPKVFINKPISVNLTADSADTVHLQPGLQDVSQELADHWFVKAHCQDLSELTDDTAANAIVAQLEAQVASTQSELEKQTAALAESDSKLKEALADAKAKDKRIAELEKQVADTKPPAK